MDDAQRGKKRCSNLGPKIFIGLVFIASTIAIGIFYHYNPDYRFEIRANWIATKWNSDLDEDPECGYLFRGTWRGRLGNVMFQYAAFYGMVEEYRRRSMNADRRKIIFASSMPQTFHDTFENLSLFRYNDAESRRLLQNVTNVRQLDDGGGCCSFRPIDWSKLKCDNVSVEMIGWRQSFKYFENVRDEIRREFVSNFRKSVRDECDRRFANISIEHPHCSIVGVHLRRGDFATSVKISFGYSPATERYLQRAVRFFEETYFSNLLRVDSKFKCLVFLILGDDYEWNLHASKNITLLNPGSTRIEHIDSNVSSPAIDLCLLSKCDHVAISAGTFSWWAGYLGRGIVTYQREFAQNGLRYQYVPGDVFLPDWIPL